MPNNVVMVGITGGTGSGKSTIASLLFHNLYPNKSIIIDQDSYYKDRSHLCVIERKKCNFDEPESVDFDLMYQHLKLLKSNIQISKPIYCFKKHIRKKKTVVITPKPIVIVDGLLILCHQMIRKCLDVKIFIDAPEDIRFIRRAQRDIKERGRDIDSVINQYLSTVKPMHDLHVEPMKRYADLIIENGDSTDLNGHVIIQIDDYINQIYGGVLR